MNLVVNNAIFYTLGCREAILKQWMPWLTDKFVYAIPLNIDEKGFHEAMAIQISKQIRQLMEESIISMVR